jgi:negative regulator of replication initiation
MKTIRISEEVWEAMAKIGKFGETPDDVLRKVFNIKNDERGRIMRTEKTESVRPGHATTRMSSFIARNRLHVEFATGESDSWELPSISDKAGIRKTRDLAVDFATKQGASLGQVNAVKKTLTDAGYHLVK